MRHLVAGRRLSRSSSHRRALANAQATALLREGRIETTLAKAKGGTLHDMRIINKDIKDREVLKKLMEEIAPKYATRPGGYTRILKTGIRRGDAAPTALIELV